MKKYLLIALIFLSAKGLYAQQDPLYSQYMINPIVINPAYTGLYDRFVGSVGTRFQWSGIEGAPNTFTGTANMSLFDNKMGAGLIFVRDELGANTNNEIYLTYGYQIEALEGTISFGLQAGIINYQFDYNDLTRRFIDDPEFPLTQEGSTQPNVGGGILYSSDKLMLGFSVPRIMNTEFDDGILASTRYERHFYGYGAYLLDLSPALKFKPAILLKGVDGAPLNVDLNFNIIYSQRYSAGLFTRNFHSHGVILGFDINDTLNFSYAYELYDTPAVTGLSFSTHELMLRFDLALLSFHDVYKTYF